MQRSTRLQTEHISQIEIIMQRSTRLQTNLRNLRISQDVCYVRMTDNVNILTIYGQRAHLLNNNAGICNVRITDNYDFLTIYGHCAKLLNNNLHGCCGDDNNTSNSVPFDTLP